MDWKRYRLWAQLVEKKHNGKLLCSQQPNEKMSFHEHIYQPATGLHHLTTKLHPKYIEKVHLLHAFN